MGSVNGRAGPGGPGGAPARLHGKVPWRHALKPSWGCILLSSNNAPTTEALGRQGPRRRPLVPLVPARLALHPFCTRSPHHLPRLRFDCVNVPIDRCQPFSAGAPAAAAAAAAAACCPLPAHCLHLAGCPDQGPLPDITTLYRRIAAWSDFTEPLAVLRLGRPAGALHFLPPPRGQAEAAGGLLAVGDDAGTLHLLSLDGRVVAQHHTGGWIAGAGMP